jgi:hypothetical protein
VAWLVSDVERSGGKALRTSTVSNTLTTPGCLRVRSFLTAFLASGRRDLLAMTSKEKILQCEPSSYGLPNV